MQDHPILFSAAMVQAVLSGQKTQTRRVIKPQPSLFDKLWMWAKKKMVYALPNQGELETSFLGIWDVCPYGKPGDRLWVRETWAHAPHGYVYRADYQGSTDGAFAIDIPTGETIPLIWKPSIHMPRAASRITLEVVSVRVERVRDISESDAIAEGTKPSGVGRDLDYCQYRAGFQTLWDSINSDRGFSWESNPWVWVIEFKKV